MSGAKADDVDLSVEMNEPFFAGWDAECDKSFLIGAHKHGMFWDLILKRLYEVSGRLGLCI